MFKIIAENDAGAQEELGAVVERSLAALEDAMRDNADLLDDMGISLHLPFTTSGHALNFQCGGALYFEKAE